MQAALPDPEHCLYEERAMRIRFAAIAIATASVVVSGVSVSQAASSSKKTIDKITCQEFAGLDETFQPTYVAWAWGYNQGQSDPTSAVVDVDGVEQITPYVVAECQQDPKASFWSKVKSKFK